MKKALSLLVVLAMVLSAVPSVFAASPTPLALDDNTIALPDGSTEGVTATYTAAQAGSLTITVTAMSAYDGLTDTMEQVPAAYIGHQLGAKYPFTVNGTRIYGTTHTVDVTAGETVTVGFASDMRNAAEFTVNLQLSEAGSGSGNAGTQNDPIAITALPFEIPMSGTDTFDLYYTYTAPAAQTLYVTCPVGAYLTLPNNEAYEREEADGVITYTIALAANQAIVMNPWYTTNSLTGAFRFADQLGTPENPGPGGSEPGPSNPGGSTNEVIAEETGKAVTAAGIEIPYMPDRNGTMTVVISGDPGFHIEVKDYWGETVGLPSYSSVEKTLTFNLAANINYTIYISGYDTNACDKAAATVSYKIVLGELVAENEPWMDAGNIFLGENKDLVLAPYADYSLFTYTPEEMGVYKISIEGNAVMEKWLSSTYTKEADATNGVITATVTAVGQTILLAVKADTEKVSITIEKIGSYTPPAATVYETYVNVHTPGSATIPAGQIAKLDITKKYTVVADSNDIYHLDSVSGPVLCIDLETEAFSLSAAYGSYGANVMNGSYNGKHYNFISAMEAYSKALDRQGMYVLTEDLVAFMKGYGTAQGWYEADKSSFTEIQAGTFAAESAWLVLCSYVVPQETSSGGQTGNAGTGNAGGGVPGIACPHNYDNACDTTCNTCGATREITHSYAETWNNNETEHWHECTVCKEKKDAAAHTPAVGENADQVCSVCQWVIASATTGTDEPTEEPTTEAVTEPVTEPTENGEITTDGGSITAKSVIGWVLIGVAAAGVAAIAVVLIIDKKKK